MAAGSIIKAHRHKQGAKRGHNARPSVARQAIAQQSAERGRARGGTTTKIMALTDAFDNRTDFRLFPGQAPDPRGTAALIEGLTCGQFLGDRAFDANWLREALSDAEMPPRSNHLFLGEFYPTPYKWRHLIENFSGKLKDYRGIAMRCRKTDGSSSILTSLAATIIRPGRTSK